MSGKKTEVEKRVRIALVKRDMTFEDLAKHLEVSGGYISMVVEGYRKAWELRIKIAKFLSIPVRDIMLKNG